MLVVVVVFDLAELFHVIGFQRHPSLLRELSPGFYTHFSPAHRRVICNSFILTFLGTASATVLSERLLTTGDFILHSFVCDSDTGRNTPSRILLCACPHRVVPSGWRMDLNY